MGMFSNKSERLMMMYNIQQQEAAKAEAEALRREGQTNAIGAIDAGQPLALDALGKGYDKARTEYGNASALFQPYADLGKKGLDLYSDTLGLGGEAGATRATEAFRTSPGYEKRVNLATDAVARQASATGALGSGNTMQAITDRAYDLGDQEYTGWQQNLQGLGQMGFAATGSQAGLQKGVGDLWASQGTGEAGIFSDAAKSRAGVYSGMAGLGMQNIQNASNQIGSAVNTYSKQADDPSKNMWGLGISALSSLGSLAGLGLGRGGFGR